MLKYCPGCRIVYFVTWQNVCDACHLELLPVESCQNRAAELRVQTDNGADSTLPVDGASDKGGASSIPNWDYCGNCGTPRLIEHGILEKCPQCDDEEIDLLQLQEAIK